ncbi:uncharacterized protein LOC143174573 [Nomia melanderi]|uniref:uncharacterized protein LOC143174573 n=1 Tax=Nomia melanderi TaxID=2448451 RepID=UPI003FCE28C3
MVEHYPVYGQACDICTPNNTTNICPNCQCVLSNGEQRSALTVNRLYPAPSIQVCLGDSIEVDVVKRIAEDQITIHWHGVLQYGTQINDGVPFVTQCLILVGDTYR